MDDMKTKDSLALRYTGEAVDDGRMDAYALAASMVALSDFLRVAAQVSYGPDAKLDSKVSAFAHGSFLTQFTLEFGGVIATLFSGVTTPKDMYDLVAGTFKLWQFLDGEPPAAVEHADDRRVTVTNSHGNTMIVNHGVLNLVTTESAADAARQFAGTALAAGIDGFSIERDGEVIADGRADQAHCYIPVAHARPLADFTVQQWVLLESPSFKEGNKWKLSDGQSSFTASILDAAFLAEIDEGRRRFGKGDRLLVDLQTIQKQVGRDIKTEKNVLRVLDHSEPFRQEILL